MKGSILVVSIVFVLVAIALVLFLVPASYVRVGYGGGPSPEKIKISKMSHLKHGPVNVYFYDEHKDLAEEISTVIEQMWYIPQRRLDITLGSLRVVLVAPKDDTTANWSGAVIELSVMETILVLLGWQAPLLPLWFPYKIATLQELGSSELFFFYWGIPHEATEHSLIKKVYHDPAARWIGDGLAEYISYIVSGTLAVKAQRNALKSRQAEIQNLMVLEASRNSYNLIQDFLYGAELKQEVEVAGYGVALAFWLQIAQKHEEGVIKEFWQRISQRGFPNAKEAAHILSELTGEDIWAKLQNMDLHEVLRTLEAAGAP
jgi:hypothetical protein